MIRAQLGTLRFAKGNYAAYVSSGSTPMHARFIPVR